MRYIKGVKVKCDPNFTMNLIKINMHIDSKVQWMDHFQLALSRCPLIYLVIFVRSAQIEIKIIAKFCQIIKNQN